MGVHGIIEDGIAIGPALDRGKASGEPKDIHVMRKTARKKTEPAEAFEFPPCNNTALRRAARRLGNLYDDALEPVGLKATQMGLMAELARMTGRSEGHPPSLQELAARLAIQISALTHALRPLVRDGLIALKPDDDDGRTKRAVLTPAGSARLNDAAAHWAEANQRVEAVLGSEAAATLRTLADHVASDDFLLAYAAARPGK
jgi:DNA-binding MarR family transcriptional regulator